MAAADSAPVLLHRPIIGPDFGSGTYALATITGIERGLHAVKYLVINPRSGIVVAAALNKAEVLAAARRVIRATDALRRYGEAANDATPTQAELWPDESPRPPVAQPKPRKVTRRRREVFERSQGRCHYCSAVLSLDGKWHVEHQVPRALDGTDDPSNLVAACAPCNLQKRDRTAIEFVVLQAQPTAR